MSVSFVAETAAVFQQQKTLAERALAQVDDDGFFATIDDDSNSLAIIVKHIAGNLRSRWTDFLDSDGEKPDRDRDDEFVLHEHDTRAALMAAWETGWSACLGTVGQLSDDDLDRVVYIRGEPHSVVRALQRSLAHTAQHVGQIVLLARHFAGSAWKTLSIPRGQSAEFTRRMQAESTR